MPTTAAVAAIAEELYAAVSFDRELSRHDTSPRRTVTGPSDGTETTTPAVVCRHSSAPSLSSPLESAGGESASVGTA